MSSISMSAKHDPSAPDLEKNNNITTDNLVQSSPPEPPVQSPRFDGGSKAWLTTIGGALVTFCTFGAANSFGVFQDFYASQNTASASSISWIGALQLFLMFSVGLVAGKLFDLGYFRQTQAIGSIFYVFCLFMLSLANPKKYYQLLLSQGVGVGIGLGLLLLPAFTIQAHHWKQRRSLAMGTITIGTSLGGVIFPIMLNHLLNGSTGFAWGVRAFAFLNMGLLFIANCIMTTTLPSAKNRPPRPKPDFRAIFTDWPYMCVIWGSFFVFFGMFFPYFYLQLYTRSHGFGSQFAFYTVTMINGGSLPGRLVPMLLGDRLGQLNFICPLSISCAGLVFVMLGLKSTAGIAIFGVAYGFVTGAWISLLSPLIATFATDLYDLGVRMGIVYFFVSFALLGGGPSYGSLLTSESHWSRPVIFSGVMMAVGSVFLVLARQGLSARRGSQHV